MLCESDYIERVCSKLFPEKTSALQKRLSMRSPHSSERKTDLSNYQDSLSSQVRNIPIQRQGLKINVHPKESRALLVSAGSNIRQKIEVEARKLIVDLQVHGQLGNDQISSRLGTQTQMMRSNYLGNT